MEKLLSLLIVSLMLLTLVACSSDKNDSEKQQSAGLDLSTPTITQHDEKNTASPTDEQNTPTPTQEIQGNAETKHVEFIRETTLHPFSEGLAWIKFSKLSRDVILNEDDSETGPDNFFRSGTVENYVGCIDKEGKVVFYFPENESNFICVEFSNGVAYCKDSTQIKLDSFSGK